MRRELKNSSIHPTYLGTDNPVGFSSIHFLQLINRRNSQLVASKYRKRILSNTHVSELVLSKCVIHWTAAVDTSGEGEANNPIKLATIPCEIRIVLPCGSKFDRAQQQASCIAGFPLPSRVIRYAPLMLVSKLVSFLSSSHSARFTIQKAVGNCNAEHPPISNLKNIKRSFKRFSGFVKAWRDL